MRQTKLGWAAGQAVSTVMAQREINYAAQLEPEVSYCFACGQVPDGDRRMDHARRIALEILAPRVQPKRYELDAALAIEYLVRKK